MDKQAIIARLSKYRPPFLDLFNCVITDVNPEEGTCEMEFEVSTQFCHSGDIVQGGFVTMMLDSISAHNTFAKNENIIGVSTLELKVSYFAVSRAGKFRAVSKIEKLTRNFAFLSADLYNSDNIRTASLTSTAKVSYRK